MEKDNNTAFLAPLKVLLVEDSPVDRKVLQRMFKDSLLSTESIYSADTLEAAFDILEHHDVDVVILDLNLPDSHGVETLLKLTEQYPKVAVVVNTGAYEDDVGLKTLGIGAQDFIVKGKYKAYGIQKAIYYAKERKRFETELKEAYTKLQETQNHLIQAEKMNVVGRLASGVAHEVKNPLATILFAVTFLDERLKQRDEKIEITLNSLREAAKRANDIINDLLDFANLSRLHRRTENINSILEKAILLTYHLIEKQKIRIKKDLDMDLPEIEVDGNRLEQVFVNLIMNAAHAMPEGGELKIRTYRKTSGERMLEADYSPDKDFAFDKTIMTIEVEDTGTGIPTDKLDKVFDPFFTTKRAQGGVGLGLAVAKNIIETHHGKITIKNRSEGGVLAQVFLKID